jgi:Tfp pilus assembly protein PilE
MAMNKKGIFFTMISLLFVVVIIAFFMPNTEYYSYSNKIPALKARATKANGFLESVYGDLGERALRYSSYNAIKSLNDYIDYTGKPLSSLQADFKSVLINGTIGGTSLESYGITRMRNSTLPYFLSRFSKLAENELNLKTNITINSVSIYQSESTGYSKFAVDLNLSVYLDSGIATWNTTKVITSVQDIDRFYDPYYISNAGHTHLISFSNITKFSSPDQVFGIIDRIEYTYEPKAPNFLMRFENKSANSSCCGIESLINPVELGINSDSHLSYADYCYFGQPASDSCGYPSYVLYNFTHLTATAPGEKFYAFKLEVYHTNKYNLTGDIKS